jgi:hypothetical protein
MFTLEYMIRLKIADKRQELLTLREHMGSAQVLVGSMLLFILVFCVVFVFVLCLVYSMLPGSLDCLFLISPSVFSKVYV